MRQPVRSSTIERLAEIRGLFQGRRTKLVLGSFVVLALVFDAVFYLGFFGSDDRSYMGAARALVTGSKYYPNLAALRLGVTVPSALPYWLWGSVHAVAWAQVVYHLLLVVIAFVLGGVAHDRRTGLCAAFLAATHPLFYLFAGGVLPDNPSSVYLGLSMIALTIVLKRATPTPIPTRTAATWYTAAGVFLGLSYLCKETAVILTVPMAIAIIASAARHRSWHWIRDGAFLAMGLGMVIGLELVALHALTGEWLVRLWGLGEHNDAFLARMGRQGATPWARMSFAFQSRLQPFIPLSIWLFLVSSLAYWRLRSRSLLISLCFWWIALYLTIGSTSLSSWVPPSIQTRYYSYASLPLLVMTSACLVCVANRLPRYGKLVRWPRAPQRVIWALALVVGGVSLFEAWVNLEHAGIHYHATDARALAMTYQRARARFPEMPVVIDRGQRSRMLPLFWDHPNPEALFPRAERYPTPPFVYLVAAGTFRDSETGDFDKERFAPYHAYVAEVVDVPASRGEALRRRFLGRQWDDLPGAPTHSYDGLVVVVAREPSPELKEAARVFDSPIHVLSGENVRLYTDDGDTFIHWNGGLVVLQLFHSESFKRAPRNQNAQLQPPTRDLNARLRATLTAGPSARGVLFLYGYDESGGLIDLSRLPFELDQAQRSLDLRPSLRLAEPASSVQLRLVLDQVDGAPATIRVREVAVQPP